MEALLSGPSRHTACCFPSVNRETGGMKQGCSSWREKEGGGYGYYTNGINGCVEFKLTLNDSGGLTIFLSDIGRFPLITLSLSLSPPLLFLPLALAAIYS